MSKIWLFLSFLLLNVSLQAQQINIGNTLFLGDGSCVTGCRQALVDNGDIVFVGHTTCNGIGDFPSTNRKEYNIVVGKVDGNFQTKWIKIFGSNKDDDGISICKSTDDGYCIVSKVDEGSGDVTTFYGTRDLFVTRINNNGDVLWHQTIGSIASQEPSHIIATPDSGFLILGASTCAGIGDDISFQFASSPFLYDWILAKLDKNGNKQWVKVYGGMKDENTSGKILCINNNIYLISSSTSIDYDCNDTSWHGGKNTWGDYYVIKLDSAGNKLWSKSYGGTQSETVTDAMFDKGDNTIMLSGISYSNNLMVGKNNGQSDIWIVKIDTSGVFKWGKVHGGSGYEAFSSISKTSTGYGLYTETTSRGPGVGYDGWLFFLDNLGNQLSNKFLYGSGSEHIASLLPYNNGFIFSGGSTSYKFNEGIKLGTSSGYTEHSYIGMLYFFPADVPMISTAPIGKLNVYPNPSNTEINIKVPKAANVGTLTIYNTQSVKVFEQSYKNIKDVVRVSTTQLPNGAYNAVWRTTTSNTIYTSIFIKQ